ncbi:uncharacterized protein LOC116617026 [Nematostella vectensis]|uniref:uncharacterized protein LOC116617026 n=1 Tax=Nematostella vectensis TaxID=45351 RepID=UPI0020774E9E|nr:uncharacterized protein LOC116617026 [Nematostella vectensis]XP_048589131.1 uncharacterized protein LOC116617026 [Nematostella vectensis]
MRAFITCIAFFLVVGLVFGEERDESNIKASEKSDKLPKGAPSLPDAVAAKKCKPMFAACRKQSPEKVRECFTAFYNGCFLKVRNMLNNIEKCLSAADQEIVDAYMAARLEQSMGGE